jgi:hypothetical protein
MNQLKQQLRYLMIGAIACLFAVSITALSQPAQSYPATAPVSSQISSQNVQVASGELQQVGNNLTAQGMTSRTATRYVAVLTKDEVVPMAASSTGFGAAEAMLMGDRLMVRGNFTNLSSPLRDYATDPLNPPNPKITSGVHLHQGEPAANGPFQFALQVSPDQSGLQGQFMGEYPLNSAQRQALADGKLYMDIHTKQNRAGELRGIFKPY